MAVTPYATKAEMDAVLSEYGVDASIQDNEDGAPDSAYSDAAIERASAVINQKLAKRYTVAVLAANTWVKWCCAHLASCWLRKRRGNPCPDGLAAECQKYLEDLQAIADGQEPLIADDGTLVATRFDTRPAVSNMTVDGRWPRTKIRRVPSTSTGGQQADGVQRHDAPDYYTYP